MKGKLEIEKKKKKKKKTNFILNIKNVIIKIY